MSKSEKNDEFDEQENCSNTGHEKRYCECFDCRPGRFDLTGHFAGCRNLDEVLEKTYKLLDYLGTLDTGGFGAEVKGNGEWLRLHDPLVEGSFFIECKGCGYPLLLDVGDDPDRFLCTSCHEIDTTRADQPKYYDDLFNYLYEMFEMAGQMKMALNEPLGWTKMFCNVNGFDFEAVEARLQANGGYDEGEVLMNCVGNIPLFEELPLLLDEDDDEQEEE